jgi:hypothetical protein
VIQESLGVTPRLLIFGALRQAQGDTDAQGDMTRGRGTIQAMSAQPLDIRLGRFAHVESRLDTLGQKVDGLQWRMTSLILVTWITTILTMLLRH